MKTFKVGNMKYVGLLMLGVLSACGGARDLDNLQSVSAQQQQMKKEISALMNQLNTLVSSDFSSCASNGSETSDPLIRNICQIAQASTNEGLVKLKGELVVMINHLQTQADSDKLDMVAFQTSIGSLQSTIAALQVSISTGMSLVDIASDTSLAGYAPGETVLRQQDRSRVNGFATSYGAALVMGANPVAVVGNTTFTATAATDLINIVNNFTADTPVQFTSGGTLPAGLVAATTYYVQNVTGSNFQVSLSVGGSVVNITSTGSGTHRVTAQQVTITTSAVHGLVAGNTVSLASHAGGNGLVSGDLAGDFVVKSTPSITTLTLAVNRFPITSGSIGGSAGVVKQLLGSGMTTVWATADGEQLLTSYAAKAYTFLVTGPATVFAVAPGSSAFTWIDGSTAVGAGYLCWSKVNASANAATIKAGGANVTCK